MKESDITKKILANLNARPGVFAYKNHGGRFSKAGIPDVEVMFVDRRFLQPVKRHVYIEVKRPGEKPTKLQAAMHKKIENAGGCVLVATCLGEALLGLSRCGIPEIPA